MIEQVGNALNFHAFFVASRVGKTGLTTTVDVYRNGTQIITDDPGVEVAGGLYRYTLLAASVTVEGEYVAVFKTTDATVDQKHVPAIWSVGRAGIEHLNIDVSDVWDELLSDHIIADSAGAKLGDLALLDVITFAPALSSSTLTLVRGDDYRAEDQRALSFTSSNWPDLTGAEIRMTMRRRREAFGSGADPIWFSVIDTYSLRDVGGVSQTVVFELTKDDTALLVPGDSAGKWDVQAILATTSPSTSPSPSPSVGESEGNVITLSIGTCTVIEDQTRRVIPA